MDSNVLHHTTCERIRFLQRLLKQLGDPVLEVHYVHIITGGRG